MKGDVTIEVALSAARLVNELHSRGIPVTHITKREGKTRFTVAKTYARKTFAFFDQMCYTYSVVSFDGLVSRAKRGAWRLGILAGILAFIGVYVYLGGFVWKVKVTGQKELSAKTVIDRVAALGVKRGTRIKAIDCSALEAALRAGDGILECTVSVRGVTLTVAVMEDTQYIPPKSEARADIVSDVDAEITRVICERGTPRVQVGDRVAAGSVLIEGASYSTMGDDYGNPVLLEEYAARGRVYGKTVLSKSVVVPKTYVAVCDTGAKKRKTVLRLFGLQIGKDVSPFAVYRVERRSKRLEPIPITVESITYFESEPVTCSSDPQTLVEAMQGELEQTVALRGGTAGKVTHTVTESGDLYYVSVYMESEILLGVL